MGGVVFGFIINTVHRYAVVNLENVILLLFLMV